MKTSKKYIVWKVLKDEEHEIVLTIRPNNKYIVINVDEPYAKAIFELLKTNETALGRWTENDAQTFEEFISG